VKVEIRVSDSVALEVDFAILQDRIVQVDDVNLSVNFAIGLEMQPMEVLSCLAAAAHEV
jgi:hypothetical protein